MRERLIRAPWWAQALFSGLIFAIVAIAISLVQAQRLAPAVMTAVTEAVFFGLFFGLWSARRNRRYLATRGDMTPEQLRAMKRAVRRGPAPADPAVRAAAARVVDLRVREQRHLLWWAVPLYLVLIAVVVSLARSDGPGWWGGVVFFAGMLVWTIMVRRRLYQRRAVLAADPDPQAA